VSWAGTFTLSKWFIVGIIGFTAIMVAFNGRCAIDAGMRDTTITWESGGHRGLDHLATRSSSCSSRPGAHTLRLHTR